MAKWKDMFVHGGVHVLTRKSAFPGLADTDLPDILIKSVVQHGGDILNQVERRLLEEERFRKYMPEVWAAHFAEVERSVPKLGLLSELLQRWSWIVGAAGTAWGIVQQLYEDFPDWEALWPAIAGVLVVVGRYAVKWILRQVVRQGIKRMQTPKSEDQALWNNVAAGGAE